MARLAGTDRRTTRADGVRALTLFLLMLAPTAGAVVVDGRETLSPIEPERVEFQLPFKAEGFSLALDLALDTTEVSFNREPVYTSSKVVRGAIPLGPDRAGIMGFAWDVEAQQLYIDKNANLDLTDDRAEDSSWASDDKTNQSFILVDVQTPFGERALLHYLEFTFTYRSANRVTGTLKVTSGWEGDIELDGKAWRMSVVNNLDGAIDKNDLITLNRPSTMKEPSRSGRRRPMRSRSLRSREASPVLPAFPADGSLEINGRFYDLAFTFEQGRGGPTMVAAFEETAPVMGELVLKGKGISRLVLSGPRTVVLNEPGQRVSIPAGDYTRQQIVIDGGQAGTLQAKTSHTVSVRKGQSTELNVGGPLDNSLTVKQTGSLVNLDYQLRGIGGEVYTTEMMPLSFNPASFQVRKDGKTIKSYQFRYG